MLQSSYQIEGVVNLTVLKKKQVNLRLNPGTIEQLDALQKQMILNGFSVSKADVVEDAIHELYKRTFLEVK